MNIDHGNFKSFTYRTSIWLLAVGFIALQIYFFYSSFFISIVFALMFLMSIFALFALFIYSVGFAYKRLISIRDFFKILTCLILSGCIGMKLMFFGNDIGSKARLILINNTGNEIDSVKIGKATNVNVGNMAINKWNFVMVNLYGNCEIPFEYISNGVLKQEIVCGCNRVLVGEFRKFEITGSRNEKKCYENQ